MSITERKPWTEEEDNALQEIVLEIGTARWSDVSNILRDKYGFPNKSGKQCRERWNNHIDPAIKRLPWTAQEDKTLFEYQRKYGNCWTEIAKTLPGRTENSIKNRFYSAVRKGLRKYNKYRPENLRITASVKKIIKEKPVVEFLIKKCFMNQPFSEEGETFMSLPGAQNQPCGQSFQTPVGAVMHGAPNWNNNLSSVAQDDIQKFQNAQNHFEVPSFACVNSVNNQQLYERACWANYVCMQSLSQIMKNNVQLYI
ncbi:unnamed protein product [Blepharisma stoltei]|uniref:Myb-like DNA-binding domain containing protein n=1 Tax=Blepharisma stoltei TaxID=1481888 RepID=A0AAU9IM95_9CILI|nr:unnamed protein product [Blepharisma stoltei]